MSVLLYAIDRRDARPGGCAGLDERPLRAVDHDGLTARRQRRRRRARRRTSAQPVGATSEVVELLMAGRDAPAGAVRHHRWPATRDRDAAAERQAELHDRARSESRDRVEYAVSVGHRSRADDAAAGAAGHGVPARRLRDARARHVRALERATPARLVRAARRTAHGTRVPRRAASDGREFVAQRRRRSGSPSTGPWPPYSFVAAGMSTPRQRRSRRSSSRASPSWC